MDENRTGVQSTSRVEELAADLAGLYTVPVDEARRVLASALAADLAPMSILGPPL